MKKEKLCGVLAVVAVVMVLAVITILKDDTTNYKVQDESSKKNEYESVKFAEVEKRKDIGVIKKIDLKKRKITIKSAENNISMEYSYKGYTEIRSKYGVAKTAEQLNIGDIVNIEYDIDEIDRELELVQCSKDVWEYENIKNYEITENDIKIGKLNFKKKDILFIDSVDNYKIDTLEEGKNITARGMNERIYYLKVE